MDQISLTKTNESFGEVAKLTLPVAFGYLPLGIAFGILFGELGYGWYWPGIIGLVVFAGSAQFMAISMLKSQASLREIFVVTLILNLRHIFYGLSFLTRYKNYGWSKWYMIFGLTDETYSLLTTLPAEHRQDALHHDRTITWLNHFYWSFGCLIGGIFGELAQIKVVGLDFALTALFVVLAIEQYFASRRGGLVLTSLIIALVMSLAWPKAMLISSIMISALVVIGMGKREAWK